MKITTLPLAGTLTNNGVAVTAGQFVSAADIAAGKLTSSRRRRTPTAPGYASFTFQVQDDGGTANGGVDLDHDGEHDHGQRDVGQRRAGGHRTRR